MTKSFPEHYKQIADDMGIALYQRFSINEASLFLRCKQSEIVKLVEERELGVIKVAGTKGQFFGYQLLDYLLANATEKLNRPVLSIGPERVLRIKEVVSLTGLSRTTLWRMERRGEFPARLRLSVGSVGWRYSDIQNWIERDSQKNEI